VNQVLYNRALDEIIGTKVYFSFFVIDAPENVTTTSRTTTTKNDRAAAAAAAAAAKHANNDVVVVMRTCVHRNDLFDIDSLLGFVGQ